MYPTIYLFNRGVSWNTFYKENRFNEPERFINQKRDNWTPVYKNRNYGIPVRVDIYAFFVTWSYLIFFDHHPIPHLWIYKMDLRCWVYCQFTWYCVFLVCKGRDGRRNCCQKHVIGSLSPVFVNDGFTWMECCSKACHTMAKAGIYRITNDETVRKWHGFFRVAPVPLFFCLLLLLMVTDFDSNDAINNVGETKTFVLFLPRYNAIERDEEVNNGSRWIFFHHCLWPRSFSSRDRPPTINHSAMAFI